MYDCTTIKLISDSYEIELPFPVHGGTDYQLTKIHTKFNFWRGAWNVVDKGISDDGIRVRGFDWDINMQFDTYDCNPCYQPYRDQKNCMPLCFNVCFDSMSQLFCFNPGICFKTVCGDGVCFDPKLGIYSGGCFDGSNCHEGKEEFLCFGMCSTKQKVKYNKCNKIIYSEEFLQKFENLNLLMDLHEEVVIVGLGDCLDGVYVIQNFSYDTVQRVPGLFSWALDLKLVSK